MLRIAVLLIAVANILLTLAPTAHAAVASQISSTHVSRQEQPAKAKQILTRLNGICRAAQSLSYEADVAVSIKALPAGPVRHDRYIVTGTFQHLAGRQPAFGSLESSEIGRVYVRLDEVHDGKTVFTLVGNPQHLYAYSPVTKVFEDYGNVPVDFAVWDMLMAQGAGRDALAQTSRHLGYYFDITGFFNIGYAGDSPWPADHGSSGTRSENVVGMEVKGRRRVERLSAITPGSDDNTTWNVFVDPRTGLPLRATMEAVGPSLDGPANKEQIEFQEDYISFIPSQTVVPESVFAFTLPPDATSIRP